MGRLCRRLSGMQFNSWAGGCAITSLRGGTTKQSGGQAAELQSCKERSVLFEYCCYFATL